MKPAPDLPPIGITMGDPAGIGPEIAVKVLAARRGPERCLLLGDAAVLRREVQRHAPGLELCVLERLEQARFEPGRIELLATSHLDAPPPPGELSAECGRVAAEAVARGIALAREGRLSALVTAPIHKESLALAGLAWPGHTEMLAELGGATRVAMMLVNDELRVVLVTIHCSLREAIERIDLEAELEAIRMADRGARLFGIARPRVAVAGLNPHAGEGGRFGREELEVIAPAVAAARAEGIDASGPWPGDTVFLQARQGRFDVVVAQYHDQGLIPIKYVGLERGVNLTLGLPFVRTSPDHGTAFDIAGRGVADPTSLATALEQAIALVRASRQEAAGCPSTSSSC